MQKLELAKQRGALHQTLQEEWKHYMTHRHWSELLIQSWISKPNLTDICANTILQYQKSQQKQMKAEISNLNLEWQWMIDWLSEWVCVCVCVCVF